MKIATMKQPSELVIAIETIVKEKNVEYIDAVMYYCERNNLEIETIADIIKQNAALKSKIQAEAESLKMVKRTGARLPV